MEKNRRKQSEAEIIFLDPREEIASAVKERIKRFSSSLLSSEKKENKTDRPKSDIIFLLAEGFSKQKLRQLLASLDNKEEKNLYVLVSKKITNDELLPFLKYPIRGIVSLSFLEENTGIVLKSLLFHEVFMEPSLHIDLIDLINEKRDKKKQIKRLLLKEESQWIFSEKEMAVFQLILDGYGINDIAGDLYFANSTIASHVSAVIKKLDVNDRTAAVVKAIRNGLVVAKR